MNEAKRQCLLSAGVDLDGALERFMDNETLYDTFLKKFLTNSNYIDLGAALAAKDWRLSLDISHNLKGVTGSLGFTTLYGLMCTQVDKLRQDSNEEAAALMEQILPEYERMCEVVKRALEQ